MDTQRLFLAIGLSMVVMLVWYTIFPPPPPEPLPPEPTVQEQAAPDAATAAQQASSALTSTAPAMALPAPAAAERGEPVVVTTPRYIATFDTEGGRLLELELRNYRVEKENINWGDVIPPLAGWFAKPMVDPDALMNMVQDRLPNQPVFGLRVENDDRLSTELRRLVYAPSTTALDVSASEDGKRLEMTGQTADGLLVHKVFTFHPDTYIIDYEVTLANQGQEALRLVPLNQFGEGPDLRRFAAALGYGTQLGPIYREDGSIDTETADDIEGKLYVREPEWVGIGSNYFLTAVSPETPVGRAQYVSGEVLDAQGETAWVAAYGIELAPQDLAPGRQVSSSFRMYLGPKATGELAKFGHDLEGALDLNLEFIAAPMLGLLRWFHDFTGNWGFDIILLTILVRVLLFPLTYKGMVSMKRMQKLQPRMQSLREKLKGEKEKLNKEMMALYKRHRVNPLGGCLPILVQLPIFLALYSALLGAIELRHAAFFGWLVDLSAKDGLYIMPVLMGVTMFLQQKLSPTSLDPTQAKIMMWLPVIFTAFMFNFPSGLVLYWFVSNLLSIAQQMIINRVHIPEPEEATA